MCSSDLLLQEEEMLTELEEAGKTIEFRLCSCLLSTDLRRDRAADVGHGLPAGDILRPGSSPAAGAPAAGCAMRPNPHPPDSGLVGISLRGFQPLVPLRMPLRLASRAHIRQISRSMGRSKDVVTVEFTPRPTKSTVPVI